jgi:cysteine synthase A
MDIRESILDCVGGTPLVAIDRFAPQEGGRARVLAKMESMNPYSVKDRPALWMLRKAEARGEITPGETTIIEATSGNTGIGLAMASTLMGYDLVLCMSEAMSEERKAILRALGARLELTPGELHTKGAKARALELLEEIPNAYYIRQHDNLDNRQAHIDTTAEELWEQTDGQMDAFVAGLGTCGTLTGVSTALKTRKPELLIVGIEPAESPYYRTGEFTKHRIPGVVPGFTPEIYDPALIDRLVDVPADVAWQSVRDLAHREGIMVGITSGATAWAARELAKEPELEGGMVVCVFADTGERYLSTPGLWL